jgi:ribosomal-protein-alanine N-acetyltransferase
MAAKEGQGAGRSIDRMIAPTLRTDRLVLRQLTLADAPALFDVLSDDEVMRYWSSGPHSDVDESRDYIGWNADSSADHVCWAITVDGSAALGWVILLPHRSNNLELGYILGRAHWRNGYAHEAICCALDYAFEQLGARRVMADTDPENAASVGLLSKLGFQREGYLREEWETHIGIRDSLIFGLLRNEWAVRKLS